MGLISAVQLCSSSTTTTSSNSSSNSSSSFQQYNSEAYRQNDKDILSNVGQAVADRGPYRLWAAAV